MTSTFCVLKQDSMTKTVIFFLPLLSLSSAKVEPLPTAMYFFLSKSMVLSNNWPVCWQRIHFTVLLCYPSNVWITEGRRQHFSSMDLKVRVSCHYKYSFQYEACKARCILMVIVFLHIFSIVFGSLSCLFRSCQMRLWFSERLLLFEEKQLSFVFVSLQQVHTSSEDDRFLEDLGAGLKGGLQGGEDERFFTPTAHPSWKYL